MKAKDYIFAKHPNGGVNYPAIAIKVTAKFVYYTDDEGQKIKVSKSKCRLQTDD